MEDIEIPKWVKEQLLETEKVVSKFSHRSTDYYATDRRLLRFRGKGKSDYDTLEYDKMSIRFKRFAGFWWHVVRGLMTLCGLLMIAAYAIDLFGLDAQFGWSTGQKIHPLLGLFLVFTGLFIIVKTLSLYGYYQIESPGFSSKDLKKWLIGRGRWGSGKADRFAKVIEEKVSGNVD